jgi:nitroreductase
VDGAASAGERMSRRSLLRRTGLGAATVLVAGAGATSYRAYDAGVFSIGDGPAYAPWRTWDDDPSVRGLVGAALLAPSPHNTQAWRFRVLPGQIDVFGDASRGLGVIDPYGRELALSRRASSSTSGSSGRPSAPRS